MQLIPSITFTDEDMLLKDNKHDIPLYYTGYIGLSRIERIQVDPGSALSIIPRRVMNFLGTPLHCLLATTTTIYDFNTGSSHPLGKIRLLFQIGDLKSEMMCYMIDADMSYNMLLRRPWIHANRIIPSTLHQCFKYVDDRDLVIRTVFAETHTFKGVENYFNDSLLYQDSNDVVKETSPEDLDSGNEGDAEDNLLVEPIIAYLDDSTCNNDTIEFNDEWVLNESIAFDYSLCHDHVLPSTKLLTSFHMPIPSSMKACTHVEDSYGATFIVPSTKKDQSTITFGRVQPQVLISANSEEELPPPQFFRYSRSTHKIMERMGYDLRHGDGLNFG